MTGSPDVFVNGKPGSRAVMDLSVHNCPHCGINQCITGSTDVIADNLMKHRLGDTVTEFCGVGITVTGSPDTIDDG